ncbi:hypothetical protein BS78_09G078600 [Paspalum vaginatum]|nr:hypothetical protein BS78_09G078600 [Paspalum vaginatum]
MSPRSSLPTSAGPSSSRCSARSTTSRSTTLELSAHRASRHCCPEKRAPCGTQPPWPASLLAPPLCRSAAVTACPGWPRLRICGRPPPHHSLARQPAGPMPQ